MASASVSIRQLKLQVICAFQTAYKHTVATFYVFWCIRFRKVSNSWHDLQLRSLEVITNDFFIWWTTYDFQLIFHYNYVFILYRFQDIINNTCSKLQRLLTWLWLHFFHGYAESIMCMLVHVTIDLRTEFELPSFTRWEIWQWSKNLTSSSAVADKPARRAASLPTAK